jgi:endonuclease YncB( thermonuclease family)
LAKPVLKLFFSVVAVIGGLCLSPSATLLQAKETNPVIDGDTLVIEGRLVQLAGIDAPELGQRCFNQGKSWRCGLEAALALRKLISFGDVICETDKSKPQSAQASCSVADKDLATTLLQQGYAVALPEASSPLQAAQNSAKEAKFGIWRGDFVAPASWRDGVRLPGEEEDPQYCVIKGTINEKDQRVFYVPSDEGYDAIVIDPDRGERMFCSDDQAILRGWRPFPKAKS